MPGKFIATVERNSKLMVSHQVEQFAFMDTHTDYVGDSCWRTSEGLIDIKPHLYFYVADIQKIVYNEEENYTLLLFKQDLLCYETKFNALKFYAENGVLKIDFLHNYQSIYFTPYEAKAHFSCRAKEMFKMLCMLPKLQTKYAFISLNGYVYPSSYLSNYITSEEKRKLREIYNNFYD